MATVQELMENLKNKREGLANQGGPFAKTLDKTVGGLQTVASALDMLHVAIKNQIATNAVAKRTGEATDVQESIRSLLQTKIAEDKIEAERHKRMMDMAESLVPQVTEEQLKAIRMQQLAYREHKKTLEATIEIEEKKAAIQKKTEEEIAKRRIKGIETQRAEANFAVQDKYGTIEKAIAGFGNSGGDSLGKFLVAGLGRYVKEKKETPVSEAIKEKYDAQVQRQNDIANNRKAQIDKTLGYKKEDINEEFAIRAAKQGISDPGSAAKLYADRNQRVKSLAGEAEGFEKQLLSGKAKFGVPKMEQAVRSGASAIQAEVRGISTAIDSAVSTAMSAMSVAGASDTTGSSSTKSAESSTTNKQRAAGATPSNSQGGSQSPTNNGGAKPAPKNAKFERANTQTTRPNGPTRQRTSPQATVNKPVASVGKFGSKAGAVNVGGITKALGGIVGKLGSLAGSALKFLGPWGMVASAIMSFDRLVPIFSSLAGAIMDLTKLIMPLLVSTAIEGFAQILGGFNGLISLFDQSFLGRGWNEDKEVVSKVDEAKKQAEADAAKRAESKRQAAQGGVAVDTTSAGKGASVGQPVLQRRETALTSPAEANAVSEQARASVQPQQSYALADWREQQQQNKAMRESVMAAASNPGTTPVMVANPSLAPWMV